jgi:hypothetical protein
MGQVCEVLKTGVVLSVFIKETLVCCGIFYSFGA